MNKFLLAAAFAGSNMGMDVNLKQKEYSSLDEAVVNLLGHYIESDDMYAMFMGEANSWYEEFARLNDEQIHTIFGMLDIYKKLKELENGKV